MKILHLIYSEQVAGAEKYLANLLPGLKKEGIDCQLICVCPPADAHKFSTYCEALNDKGVKTILITGTKFGFVSVARRINLYLRDNHIGYLHSHLFKSDLLAVMIKKCFNKKISLLSTKHGYQEKYLSSYDEHKGRIVYNGYYFISRYLARNINEHVAVSKTMSDLYYDLKLTRTRVKYIHHGIDMPALPETVTEKKFRLASPQLVIIGRIEKMKGHQYLFEAMPGIIKQFPEVKLLVIGNGTQKEYLVKLASRLGIENNILFMGFEEDPYPFISHSDVTVLPSLFEPFGLVYIEAFALKVPVVAFDTPACNEIVSDNETGLLAPVYNSAALADKIIYLLQHPEERKRIGENGYVKYTGYYNTERMTRETAAWYRSVITKN